MDQQDVVLPRPLGLCVRYDEPSVTKLKDGVVVVSSGDPKADEEILTGIPLTQAPIREVYDREWFGVWILPANAAGPEDSPDCDALERPEYAAAHARTDQQADGRR